MNMEYIGIRVFSELSSYASLSRGASSSSPPPPSHPGENRRSISPYRRDRQGMAYDLDLVSLLRQGMARQRPRFRPRFFTIHRAKRPAFDNSLHFMWMPLCKETALNKTEYLHDLHESSFITLQYAVSLQFCASRVF